MNQRSGATLVEVLVAIFVMGIGMLALLTLFPIGALRMAQAIRFERATLSGQNANGVALMQNVRNDPVAVTLPGATITYDLFQNSAPPTAGLPNSPLLPADDYAESYAILVDPVGAASVPPGNAQTWIQGYTPTASGVPGLVVGGVRRSTTSFANGLNKLNIYKFFTLWDDVTFDNSTYAPGAPQTVPPAPAIFRDTRFSWAYLLRRPMTSEKSVVDCTVVVFDNRPLSLSQALSLPEFVYPSSYFDPIKGTITIDYSNTGIPPNVRTGNWILDSTIYNNAAGIAGTQHAYFYRVVAVTDLSNTVTQYEVQNPIRGFPISNANPTTAYYPPAATPQAWGGTSISPYGYQGTAIVMEGIVEVFEKGPARVP